LSRLFGTNGIRGIVNRELTPSFVLELSEAVGVYFNGGKVALGCDGRTSSPMFMDAAASGLLAVGCDVNDLGLAPTPAVQYNVKASNLDGGVIITASHNPREYNGLKVLDRSGVELSRDMEVEVEKIYFEKSWVKSDWKGIGVRKREINVLENYMESIKRHVDTDRIRRAKFRVVVDPANGVGALVTPKLLEQLGCKVHMINGNIDGSFPSRSPEPTPENLRGLVEAVKSFGADLGVAHDGDADRSIFVDESGRVHWGDRTFAVIMKFFLERNPGETVVTPVSSSQLVEEIAKSYGGRVEWTKVGAVEVSWRMLKIGAKLGGEENGGVLYAPHLAVRDGAMTACLILNIMAEAGRNLSEIVAELPSYQTVKEKVACPNDLKQKVLEKLREEASGLRVETIDGVKVWFEDGSWILVRPSGTEPVYRFFAEAKTRDKAAELVSKYRSLVQRYVSETN